jgi:hypothetical protein
MSDIIAILAPDGEGMPELEPESLLGNPIAQTLIEVLPLL